MIAIVDYGMGNRRSVEKALEHVGAEPVLTADHAALRAADGIVVPGVGAFPEAMRRLGAAVNLAQSAPPSVRLRRPLAGDQVHGRPWP